MKFGENGKIDQNRWFLRFFQKPIGYLSDLTNWSRLRKNNLRPVLERPGPILSISNFIFENWHFLQPERYTCIFTIKTRHFLRCTVLVTKRYQKWKFCWCHFDFWKVWTVSFPKPSLECFYDLWLWFYVPLKLWRNTSKNRGGATKKKCHNWGPGRAWSSENTGGKRRFFSFSPTIATSQNQQND